MESSPRKRILVADDTLPMRVMLEDVLVEAGFEVVTASDGQEAWELIQQEGKNFDLLIIDLLMPKMTGFEILEKLSQSKSSRKHKVLVITGIFKSEKEIKRLQKLGAAGYITKAALVDEILFRVNQVFHLGQENTRKFPRALVSIPVEYKFRGNVLTNYTSNLSAGGAFIRTIDPPPQGERLELEFSVPEMGLKIQAVGRVAWNNEYDTTRQKLSLPGMGVEFLDLPDQARAELARYIEKRLTQEPVWLNP